MAAALVSSTVWGATTDHFAGGTVVALGSWARRLSAPATRCPPAASHPAGKLPSRPFGNCLRHRRCADSAFKAAPCGRRKDNRTTLQNTRRLHPRDDRAKRSEKLVVKYPRFPAAIHNSSVSASDQVLTPLFARVVTNPTRRASAFGRRSGRLLQWPDFAPDLRGVFLLGLAQIVCALQIHPKLCRGVEKARQP
jgi:hypothetical protein